MTQYGPKVEKTKQNREKKRAPRILKTISNQHRSNDDVTEYEAPNVGVVLKINNYVVGDLPFNNHVVGDLPGATQ